MPWQTGCSPAPKRHFSPLRFRRRWRRRRRRMMMMMRRRRRRRRRRRKRTMCGPGRRRRRAQSHPTARALETQRCSSSRPSLGGRGRRLTDGIGGEGGREIRDERPRRIHPTRPLTPPLLTSRPHIPAQRRDRAKVNEHGLAKPSSRAADATLDEDVARVEVVVGPSPRVQRLHRPTKRYEEAQDSDAVAPLVREHASEASVSFEP